VRQVKRDMVLDVHHVVEGEQVSLGQWIPGDVFPGHPRGVQLLRFFLVALDAEAHPSPGTFPIRRRSGYEIDGRLDHAASRAARASADSDASAQKIACLRSCRRLGRYMLNNNKSLLNIGANPAAMSHAAFFGRASDPFATARGARVRRQLLEQVRYALTTEPAAPEIAPEVAQDSRTYI